MKVRLLVFAAQFWLLASAFSLVAAPLRVTTWDLQPNVAAGTNAWSAEFQSGLVQQAAESLKKLRPDVILLQHVADWQTCRELAKDLQPEIYQVVTCSSWRDPRAKNLSGQTAILSRTKAYLSWSEPWQNNDGSATGGFAFAAIRAGDKTIGIFSVQVRPGNSPGMESGSDSALQKAQLARQILSLQNWKVNRPQAYILAVDFNTVPDGLHLEQLGFENAFAALPLEQRAAPDCIFTRDAGLISPPVIAQAASAEHVAITCELDLTAAKAVSMLPPPAKPIANPPKHPPVSAAPANPSKPIDNRPTLLWLAGCLAGGLSVYFLIRKIIRRIRTPRIGQITVVPNEMAGSTPAQPHTWQSPSPIGGEASRMDAAVRAGLIASLSQWLKQKVLRQLLSDRAQLMATQQIAAHKMLTVDDRLAKVEQHIQQRNQDYERRIDDLLKALISTKEENRTLIRAQITQLKAEIEKAEDKPGPRYN